jgi:hypothetical protein
MRPSAKASAAETRNQEKWGMPFQLLIREKAV